MKIGLLFALVALVHHASSSCGCGSCGHNIGIDHHQSFGCGVPFPHRPRCEGLHLLKHLHNGNDWCSNSPGGKDCVPLVVRPHDLPKPSINPTVEAELNRPVPGPCAIKKAIVKPAVLPKPVCSNYHGHSHGGVVSSLHSHSSHDCHSSHIVHGGHFHKGFGHHGCHDKHCLGAYGIQGPHGPITGPGGRPIMGPSAALHPADAVSVDLAFKLAQQNDIRKMQSEDRLSFGFRKIPQEQPARRTSQRYVPEEQIFSMNGQIVELKPVKRVANEASLAEEAAEQLYQLQEEEAEALAEEGAGGYIGGPRRPTLGEIGFGAARAPTPNLIDVPATASVGVGGGIAVGDSCEYRHGHHGDISTNCGCGHGFHGGYKHTGHGHCGTAVCGCGHESKCKIIPGNVEYKTQPKRQQICLPVPRQPDSCESAEIELSQEASGAQVHCSCVPVCYKTFNKSCKKSCIAVEKLTC